MSDPLVLLPLALVVDRVLGDTPLVWSRAPHPVVLMGRAIDALDRRLNVEALSPASRRRRGAAALVALVMAAAAIGALLTLLLSWTPFGWAGEALLASALLAQKSLVDHVRAVVTALSMSREAGARAVAKVVGRDVSSLDEAGIARAAIESAAENFSDAVVAPAFWYLLLGLPGLLVCKLVNTADSMIGHRTPRHEAFGWAAARADDLLNLVPARLSALLIAAAASLLERKGGAALFCAWRDAGLHRSPNAGWPEAAMAGALRVALGGPRRYGPLVVDGAWLNGAGRRTADAGEIHASVRTIEMAWLLLLGAASATAFIALWSAR